LPRRRTMASASVTSMVQKMAKAGLLNYERYRGLTLTPTVEAAALGFRASPPRVYRFPDPVGCAD
jgi:hypothetical protein